MAQNEQLINLTKQVGIVLEKRKIERITCRVAIAQDVSLSMYDYFKKGDMQSILTRLFAVAWLFDDDASLDCWVFNSSCQLLPAITEDNVDVYVQKNIMNNKKVQWTGTYYEPALVSIVEYYTAPAPTASFFTRIKNTFSKKVEVQTNDPVLVMFITDGETCDSVRNLNIILNKMSDANIFVQAVGAGRDKFELLQELADVNDNVDFFNVADISKLNNEQIYNQLISEKFSTWFLNQQK
jgi:hypothetical protein